MYRILRMPSTPSLRCQYIWAPLLASLTIWICVSTSLRYGHYEDSRLVLGPSSSRLRKANSIFVKRIEVKSDNTNEALVFAFNNKPQLSSRVNWSSSNFLLVEANSRNGFPLWLNKGSTIRISWEAQSSTSNQLQGVLIKGESKFEKLQPKQTVSPDGIATGEPINGKEAEYTIEEDHEYHIGVLNKNSRNMIMTMHVNVSAMVYDTTRAENMCSTAKGSCRLSLLFPRAHYIILTSPNNGDIGGWYVEVSFVARFTAYIALLGFIVIVVFLILKFFGAFFSDDHIHSTSRMLDTHSITSTIVQTREVTETETAPMMQAKSSRRTYGTNEEDDDEESEGSSSSSEDLYDEKLCVICYDEQRNCFYVPCGHCATCYDCAQRIKEGESKVCPICRRVIYKVRRLFNS